MQDGSRREDPKRVGVRMAKTSLQVKGENCSRGKAERFDNGTGNLSRGGDCKYT
jgi:hypothetical protein